MQNDCSVSGLTFDNRDEFKRRPAAERLVTLLTSDIDVSPLVIDGHWGTGKTEFTHKTINLLNEKHGEDCQTIYIDAFKADHTDDPLITVIAAVAQRLDSESGEKGQELVEKAAPLMKTFLNIGGKATLYALLGRYAEAIPDSVEKALEESSSTLDNVITQIIRQQQKAEESLEKLKDLLKEVAHEIPLIIFVDELDRCRPNFAVNMLEIIKHVFDVPNIKFVLVCNLSQLERTINHQYGEGAAARRYLDKFIKFLFKMPEEVGERYDRSKASTKHAEALINNSQILRGAGINVRGVFDYLDRIITTNDLSLREVETLVRHMEIVEQLYPGMFFTLKGGIISYGEALLSILGVYIHCFDQKLADRLSKDWDYGSITHMWEILGESKESIEEKLKGPSIDHPSEVIACALYSDIVNSDKLDQLPNWKDYVVPRIGNYFGNSFSNRALGQLGHKYSSVIEETLRSLRFNI